MDSCQKEFARICAETLTLPEPIYEFGSLQVDGQEGLADLRPLFPGKQYIGADIRAGLGVDTILDIHHIDLPPCSAGSVITLNTLEHLEAPHQALAECQRILRPDGILVIGSVLNCTIHNYPHDYFRFTPECFKRLLAPFRASVVESAGRSDFPHTIVGIGFKGDVAPEVITRLTAKPSHWKTYWSNPFRTDSKSRVLLFAPPILWHLYRRFAHLDQW